MYGLRNAASRQLRLQCQRLSGSAKSSFGVQEIGVKCSLLSPETSVRRFSSKGKKKRGHALGFLAEGKAASGKEVSELLGEKVMVREEADADKNASDTFESKERAADDTRVRRHKNPRQGIVKLTELLRAEHFLEYLRTPQHVNFIDNPDVADKMYDKFLGAEADSLSDYDEEEDAYDSEDEAVEAEYKQMRRERRTILLQRLEDDLNTATFDLTKLPKISGIRDPQLWHKVLELEDAINVPSSTSRQHTLNLDEKAPSSTIQTSISESEAGAKVFGEIQETVLAAARSRAMTGSQRVEAVRFLDGVYASARDGTIDDIDEDYTDEVYNKHSHSGFSSLAESAREILDAEQRNVGDEDDEDSFDYGAAEAVDGEEFFASDYWDDEVDLTQSNESSNNERLNDYELERLVSAGAEGFEIDDEGYSSGEDNSFAEESMKN